MSDRLIEAIHRDLVSQGLKINKGDTKKIFRTVIDNIRNTIINGIPLSIYGFGSFTTKLVKRRTMNDPENPFKEVWSIYFSASKIMKEDLRRNAE